MRESMWGIFIIVIGAVGIVAINLFQRLTVTDENTYVLMKESTKAAMYDSIDISYFRNTGNIKIVEEKFVENFTRRFAESAILNTNYKVVVHDIVEYPPKVSLSLLADVDDMKNNEFKVLQTIDSIFETVYSRSEFYDRFNKKSGEWFPGSRTIDSFPIVPEEENFCKGAKTEIDECISGDLRFLRWEELERTVLSICYNDLFKLETKDRDAFYQECICGNWSEEKYETKNSGNPSIKDGVATYTWNFKKDGPVNDIDETVTDKIIGKGSCLEDLKILKKDDLPETNAGGLECGPEGVVVMVGQSITLYPRYIPNNAVNRNLNWQIVSGASHLNLIPHSKVSFPYPEKDTIEVYGVSVGETVVSAVPVDNPMGVKPATCLVKVMEEPDFSCPPSKSVSKGSTFWPTIIKGKNFPIDYKLSYDVFNKTLASYDPSTDLITGLNPGSTNYIATVTIDGKSYSKNCPFEVKDIIPPVAPNCHPYTIIIDLFTPSEPASFENKGNKPVLNYSLFNTTYLNINSSTGLMTVKDRPQSDRYLSFRVNFKDNTSLDCPVMLEGIDPKVKGDCNVGDLVPLWDQSYIDVKPVCQMTKDLEFQTAQAIASRSVINVPIKECGRIGTISGCRGSWNTKTYSFTGEAILYPDNYEVKFNPVYSYSDWRIETLPCEGVHTKGNITLPSKYPVAKNVLTSNKTSYTDDKRCILLDTGKDPNAYILVDYSFPTEIVPGLEGSDRIVYHVQGGTEAKVPTTTCTKISGSGTIKNIDSWTWQYIPQNPYPTKDTTFRFKCSTKEDSNLDRVEEIYISTQPCGSYMLSLSNKEVFKYPQEQKSTASLTLINNPNLELENKLVSIISNSGLVTLSGNSNTAISREISASGTGSGFAGIMGKRQAYGACENYNLYSTIGVCVTAEYYCSILLYDKLDGDICYSSTTKDSTCDSGKGGTQISYNNNCYNKTSLDVAKKGDPYCAKGTSVCVDGDCNEQTCIYDEIDRPTVESTVESGKCETYSEKYSSGTCVDSGSEGDSEYKVCRYAYMQKRISGSGTSTSNYVYSSSTEAMNACKDNKTSGYACESTPTRTYTYTCTGYATSTSSTFGDCPSTHPWVTSTKCYKRTALTDGKYACSSGTLVGTNRCVYSTSPTASGALCPEGFGKINKTDTFCVNLKDFKPANLRCPSGLSLGGR